MARIRDRIEIEKPGSDDPQELVWNIAPTSGMALLIHGAIDSTNDVKEITGLTRLAVGDTGNIGGSDIWWYLTTGADTITELDYLFTEDGLITCFLVDGHDTVNFFDVAVGDILGADVTHVSQTITTVADNALVFQSVSIDGAKSITYKGDQMTRVVTDRGYGATAFVGWSFVKDSGTSYGGDTVIVSSADGGGATTFAIRDANPASPTRPVFVQAPSHIPLDLVSLDDRGTAVDFALAALEPLNDVATKPDMTIDGTSVSGDTFTHAGTGNLDLYGDYDAVEYLGGSISDFPELTVGQIYHFNYLSPTTFELRLRDSTSGIVITPTAGTHTFRETRLSGAGAFEAGAGQSRMGATTHAVGGGAPVISDWTGKIMILRGIVTDKQELSSIFNDGQMVVIDTGTGWRSYKAGGNDLPETTTSEYTTIIDPATTSFVKESGTFDLTDVTGVFVATKNSAKAGSTRWTYSEIYVGNELVVTGGAPDIRVTLSEISKWDFATELINQNYGFFNSQLTIGNGADYTTFVEPLIGISSAFQSDFVTTAAYNTPEGFFSLTYNCGPNDVFDCGKTVIVEQYLETGVEPAFYDFDNKAVTAGVSCEIAGWQTSSGRLFTRCARVKLNDATLISPTFKLSTDATGAISLTSTHNLTTPTFVDNEYHLEIEVAGTYDLSGFVFDNAGTKDLNITATGNVILQLDAGQDEPTYDNPAGANVSFDQAIEGTSFTNGDLADGTTILARNVTTSTTIEFVASLATGTGYQKSFVPGVDYTAGDVLEIWQSRKNGTTYYKERTSRILTTAEGGASVEGDELAVCPICTGFALDGAVPPISTKFTVDLIDDEIDISVGAGWQTAEAMVWWKTQMTLQTSMEAFWGAYLVQADGSFYNPDQDTLLVLFDNVTANDAIETSGRRIYNQSNVRPIKSPKTGAGALDFSWREPVTVVSTGSGLTPLESAKLLDLDTSAIQANLQIINTGVKDASILKPHMAELA